MRLTLSALFTERGAGSAGDALPESPFAPLRDLDAEPPALSEPLPGDRSPVDPWSVKLLVAALLLQAFGSVLPVDAAVVWCGLVASLALAVAWQRSPGGRSGASRGWLFGMTLVCPPAFVLVLELLLARASAPGFPTQAGGTFPDTVEMVVECAAALVVSLLVPAACAALFAGRRGGGPPPDALRTSRVAYLLVVVGVIGILAMQAAVLLPSLSTTLDRLATTGVPFAIVVLFCTILFPVGLNLAVAAAAVARGMHAMERHALPASRWATAAAVVSWLATAWYPLHLTSHALKAGRALLAGGASSYGPVLGTTARTVLVEATVGPLAGMLAVVLIRDVCVSVGAVSLALLGRREE